MHRFRIRQEGCVRRAEEIVIPHHQSLSTWTIFLVDIHGCIVSVTAGTLPFLVGTIQTSTTRRKHRIRFHTA
ncbi:uncharacterized protein METZ01_LOCUS353762, partial [marine metagenome]